MFLFLQQHLIISKARNIVKGKMKYLQGSRTKIHFYNCCINVYFSLSTFSLFERKSYKKKQTNVPLDRLFKFWSFQRR